MWPPTMQASTSKHMQGSCDWRRGRELNIHQHSLVTAKRSEVPLSLSLVTWKAHEEVKGKEVNDSSKGHCLAH